jgi:hypothetical protein
MKKLILTLTICFASQLGYCQYRILNTFVDAKNLASFYKAQEQLYKKRESKSHNLDEINKIFNKYNMSEISFTENPFLKGEIVEEILFYDVSKLVGSSDATSTLNNLINFNEKSSVGNSIRLSSEVWQKALLQGTANFMAERFEQEITNIAIHRLIGQITDNQSQNIQFLFPSTFKFVKGYLSQASVNGLFYSDLNLLRHYSELDLKALGNKLPGFIANNSSNEDVKLMMKIVHELMTNPVLYSDPVEVFNAIFAETENIISEFLWKQMELAEIFMNAFRSDSTSNRIWVNSSDINLTQIDNDYTVRFFYALLYEQIHVYFSGDTKSKIDQINHWVNKSIIMFERVDNTIKKFERNKLEEISFDDYKTILLSIADVVDLFRNDSIKYRNALTHILNIYEAIENKGHKYILPSVINLLYDYGLDKLITDRNFFQTLDLLIELTMLENSEDMKELLNSYALPIGSSSLKRNGMKNNWNISLNGYVGFNGGIEKVYNSNSNGQFNFGLTAPIGLSFSCKFGNGWSGSLFTGIIDIGSLVNNNFKNEIQSESKLRIQQFLVPSLGYFVNIKNSPFSFGPTLSYHIDSRIFDDGVIVENQLNTLRLNFSILVDIPFFTFYNKN